MFDDPWFSFLCESMDIVDRCTDNDCSEIGCTRANSMVRISSKQVYASEKINDDYNNFLNINRCHLNNTIYAFNFLFQNIITYFKKLLSSMFRHFLQVFMFSNNYHIFLRQLLK